MSAQFLNPFAHPDQTVMPRVPRCAGREIKPAAIILDADIQASVLEIQRNDDVPRRSMPHRIL